MRRLSAVALLAFGIQAQERASITGTILDASGAAVGAVQIRVANASTGAVRSATTDANGIYRVGGLILGQYSLTAQKEGFAKLEVAGIKLRAGETRTLDPVLQVAAQASAVTVSDTAVALNRTSATIGRVITGVELNTIPVNGRDYGAYLNLAGDFDLQTAVDLTIQQLSKNPKGYFLVVHADCHLKEKKKSLDRLLELDRVVKSVAERNRKDTLVLVTADHSYGIRLEGQKTPKPADVLTQLTLLDDHTGEDVPVLAAGPGSERVRGFVPNTRIFDWVVQGYGWTGVPPAQSMRVAAR
jgi:hypothetical protein